MCVWVRMFVDASLPLLSLTSKSIYLRSNASYQHEIKTIVQPRALNKTYPRTKEGLQGIRYKLSIQRSLSHVCSCSRTRDTAGKRVIIVKPRHTNLQPWNQYCPKTFPLILGYVVSTSLSYMFDFIPCQ